MCFVTLSHFKQFRSIPTSAPQNSSLSDTPFLQPRLWNYTYEAAFLALHLWVNLLAIWV
jgi:hypothetical protein